MHPYATGLAAVLMLSNPARAQAREFKLDLIGHLGGGAVADANTAAAVMGGDALGRWQVLGAGVGGQWHTALFFNVTQAHLLAGLATGFEPGLRLDLLGIGGVRHYAGWGRGLILSDDPGASATLPFAGARTRLLYQFVLRSRRLAHLGISANLDNDLGRKHVAYSYTETSWLSGESHLASSEHTIGSVTWAIALTGGVTFGR